MCIIVCVCVCVCMIGEEVVRVCGGDVAGECGGCGECPTPQVGQGPPADTAPVEQVHHMYNLQLQICARVFDCCYTEYVHTYSIYVQYNGNCNCNPL